MGVLGNFMNALGQGTRAFRESYLNSDLQGSRSGVGTDAFNAWCRWESRIARYNLNWALYQNNALREKINAWAPAFKTAYGLYKFTRHLYNPSYRLGEFWAGHLMGGLLDPEAGDGESRPSALPILTDREALRPAIARLWRDSTWQVNKEVFTRWGAVLGDVALKVVDDTARGQVRLELVHPGHLQRVEFDASGNVKAYLLRKWVEDPAGPTIATLPIGAEPEQFRNPVLYQERAFRGDKGEVTYQTFKDGKPFAWGSGADAWTEPYGFIPLVVVGHEAIGLPWGQNAWHAGLSRFLEVDDQASILGDQNRKILNAPMYIDTPAGAKDLKVDGADRSQRTAEQNHANPEPGRTESRFIYGPMGTRPWSLAGSLDTGGVIEHIRDLNGDIEKAFPELLSDTGNLGGTVTAEAVRNARSRASSKVQARRVPYDDALRRAHQMAIAIAGERGYAGYEGFNLASYAAGLLDHQIGQRPVFEVDPMDGLDQDTVFWANAQAAVAAGCPLPIFLERNGWSAADIATVIEAKEAADRKAADLAAKVAPGGAADPNQAPPKKAQP